MVLLWFSAWKLLNRSQSLCTSWVFSHFWMKLNYFKQYFCNLLVAVLDIQLFTLILSIHSFSSDAFLYLVALRTAIQNTEKKMWNICPKPWSPAILDYMGLQESWWPVFCNKTSKDMVFTEFHVIRFWKRLTTAFLLNFIGQRLHFFMPLSERSKVRSPSLKLSLSTLLTCSWPA